jgi:putative ABC transport system permease protein
LTGFSVAWGIFILIILLGAGNGLIHTFEQDSANRMLNSMRIFPGSTSKAFEGLSIGREIQFKNFDLALLQRNFRDNIIKAGATVSSGSMTISYGPEYVKQSLTGVYPNFTKTEDVKIKSGRFINELDMANNRKVIVMYEKTAKTLFTHNENPVGQYVQAGDVMYKVVGIYTNSGNSQDADLYVPFTTVQLVYCKGDSISNLIFTTQGLDTQKANDKFEKNYRKVMGKAHRFDPLDDSAIWIWNRLTNYLQQQKGANIIHTAIWVIGILTLLSGIVGVSNIMLITVRERTREFGIRKALGARPSSILKLIITESIAITTLFGYIGMVLGIAGTQLMDKLFANQTVDIGVESTKFFLDPTVDISVAIEATLTLIIAGTLAGFFPARKATKIRPIEALRAE